MCYGCRMWFYFCLLMAFDPDAQSAAYVMFAGAAVWAVMAWWVSNLGWEGNNG